MLIFESIWYANGLSFQSLMATFVNPMLYLYLIVLTLQRMMNYLFSPTSSIMTSFQCECASHYANKKKNILSQPCQFQGAIKLESKSWQCLWQYCRWWQSDWCEWIPTTRFSYSSITWWYLLIILSTPSQQPILTTPLILFPNEEGT